MKEEQARQWQLERQGGLARFIWVRGILCTGLPLGVINTWERWGQDIGKIAMHVVPSTLITGLVIGSGIWVVCEWRYRRYLARHGEPAR